MSKITLVMLGAGSSSRFGLTCKKQWLRIENIPLWLFVTNKISSFYSFDKIIVTSSPFESNYMRNFTDEFIIVDGGDTRQESIKNALKFVDSEYILISDVARSCITEDMTLRLINAKDKADCIVPYINVSDTVVYEKQTINRDEVKLIQTPQLSKVATLKKALNTDIEFTDDSSAIKNIGGTIKYVQGSTQASKLTFSNDKNNLSCLKKPAKDFFTGFGYDVHQFEDNKKMFLGGVNLESSYGFKAHSDGDVLIHSLIDALLGASGAGDIGEFFPDNDNKYKNIDSTILLKDIVQFIGNVGYIIVNVDLTIIAEQPRINPYKQEIKKSVASLLNISKQFVNIKATTSEKMGFIGRKEGVAVHSVATLKYFDWTENEYINN